jgi:hypothetical protein
MESEGVVQVLRREAAPREAARPLVVGLAGSSVATWAAVLAVILAATLPFLSSLHSYFMGDDHGLVWLFSNKPPLHFLTLFANPWTESVYGIRADELRPTLALSYQFDSIWGLGRPLGYHVSSIAFHVASALLVFAVTRLVVRLSLLGASFAGVLFAVLPVQAESVVWISGRADSIPGMFYLASFLGYALWRGGRGRLLFGASLAALFLALFSKQSAITMPATFLAYDLLAERQTFRLSRRWLAGFLPAVAMVAGYLVLRQVLFGNTIREQQVTQASLLEFANIQGSFLKSLVFGSGRFASEVITPEQAHVGLLAVWAALAAGALLALIEAGRRLLGRPAASLRGSLLFYLVAWWLISIVPLIVTYETPRHLYLGSAGVVIALALLLERAWQIWRPAWRPVLLALGGLSIVTACFFLQRAVGEWNTTAEVSQTIHRDLEREVSSTPEGSLVVVGAPGIGAGPRFLTWLWMWSMPYAAQPPFASYDLTQRVSMLEPPDVYCCLREQWLAHSRESLVAWSSRPDHPPIVVLRWFPDSGVMIRTSDQEVPALRSQVAALSSARDWLDLCRGLAVILEDAIIEQCQ